MTNEKIRAAFEDALFPDIYNTITENEKTDCIVEEPNISFNEWLDRLYVAFSEESAYSASQVKVAALESNDFINKLKNEFEALCKEINEDNED